MRTLSLRLPDGLLTRLEQLAAERGVDRSSMLRRLIDEATDLPEGTSEVPDEDELVALLAEQACAGNVGAIKALLDRARSGAPGDGIDLEDEPMVAYR